MVRYPLHCQVMLKYTCSLFSNAEVHPAPLGVAEVRLSVQCQVTFLLYPARISVTCIQYWKGMPRKVFRTVVDIHTFSSDWNRVFIYLVNWWLFYLVTCTPSPGGGSVLLIERRRMFGHSWHLHLHLYIYMYIIFRIHYMNIYEYTNIWIHNYMLYT